MVANSTGRASTKRFLFLMMPIRWDCAKSVRESSNDLKRAKSWVLTLWSVAGLVAPMLARLCSTVGRTTEKAAVRCSRVLVSVVPARPMGKAMNSTRSHNIRRAATRGSIFRSFVDFDVAAEVPA